MTLKSPCTYQGGKVRIAGTVVDHFPPFDGQFYELCAGSGAVSVEMVNRGFPPHRITMIDAGPWGWFWHLIGTGAFDLDLFRAYCDAVPRDQSQVKTWTAALRDTQVPVGPALVYPFLVLQAASFGGRPVIVKDGRWKCGLRDHKVYSRGKSTTMNPGPASLLARVTDLARGMRGITAAPVDAALVAALVRAGDLVYIDPPYKGTAGYGFTLDVDDVIRGVGGRAPVLISEGGPLGPVAARMCGVRTKGGINGKTRTRFNEEWLTFR